METGFVLFSKEPNWTTRVGFYCLDVEPLKWRGTVTSLSCLLGLAFLFFLVELPFFLRGCVLKVNNTIQYTAMQCNPTLLPNAKVTAPGMIRGEPIIKWQVIITTANIGVNSHYIPKKKTKKKKRRQSSILLLLLYLKSFAVGDIRLILRSGNNLIMSVNYTKR